jgi:hypothetical protein
MPWLGIATRRCPDRCGGDDLGGADRFDLLGRLVARWRIKRRNGRFVEAVEYGCAVDSNSAGRQMLA